ncbi:hypothetical protein BDV18DRAFT_165544 [Aspergillus unguis]
MKSHINPRGEEGHDCLLDSETLYAELYHDDKRTKRYGLWWTLGFFILTATLSCTVGVLIGYWHRDPETCSGYTSRYSPVVSNVEINYDTQRFNGSLFKENIYRKDASPEVDAAWEALGVNYRPVAVPVEEAEQSGLRSDQVQIKDSHGGGYPANVEGLHHLHCLNLLRQSLYYNHAYYKDQGHGAFKNDDFVVRRHVSHCLDILRQQLMCTIDTGVMGQVWVHPDHPEPFVDFNTQHMCKNFEDVRAWAEKNQLPENPPGDFLMPPDKTSVLEGIP